MAHMLITHDMMLRDLYVRLSALLPLEWAGQVHYEISINDEHSDYLGDKRAVLRISPPTRVVTQANTPFQTDPPQTPLKIIQKKVSLDYEFADITRPISECSNEFIETAAERLAADMLGDYTREYLSPAEPLEIDTRN